MSDSDPRPGEGSAPTDEELRALAEERRGRGLPPLDEEIARRYDPDRLRRLVAAGAGRGERLDLATRGEMERLHPGHDFGDVRVYRGALADEVTRRHSADAVTVAATGMILVRDTVRGAPGTRSGRALLAHEVTHVAQAQRGLQFALEHGGGGGAHEHEAEAVERQVAHGQPESTASAGARQAMKQQLVLQRVLELIEERRDMARSRRGE